MTFGRIALAILAVPFAWRWGPALLKSIGGLGGVFAALVSFLTPNLGRASGEHWFEFLIGIVLFWFIFKGLGLMFGFLMPKAQQFATTKGIRRFQGVCAEVGIIAVLFLAVSFLGGFTVSYQDTPTFKRNGGMTPEARQLLQEMERLNQKDGGATESEEERKKKLLESLPDKLDSDPSPKGPRLRKGA